MSTPLSIQFASKCAFSATKFFVNLTDNSFEPRINIEAVDPESVRHIYKNPKAHPARTIPLPLTTFDSDTLPFSGSSSRSKSDQMGFISQGTGRRKREVLITFRGSYRIKDDYLYIDGAFAPGTSPKGFAVHGGFAKVFQSCLPNIKEQLDLLSYDVIHCVGHSMGGALATLCAEYFLENSPTVYLYTFGAPRVGMLPHALYMQKHLGKRLNRYYYSGDVVTWLPMFPFVHMTGKRLISPHAHHASHIGYMADKGLVLAGTRHGGQTSNNWDDAEALISQGTNVAGGIGMESRSWRYLTQALQKILYAVGAAMGLTLIPCITVIDQVVACISYFLTRDPKRRPLIVDWLVGSFQALGKVVSVSKDKFIAMLRYILGLMISQVKIKTERELLEVRRHEDIQKSRHEYTLRW